MKWMVVMAKDAGARETPVVRVICRADWEFAVDGDDAPWR